MIKLKTDASFKDENHSVGLGVQIVYEKESYEYALRVKKKKLVTSVKAEIQACIYGFQCVKADFGTQHPIIYMSDSMAVIDLMQKISDGHVFEDKQLTYLADLLNEFDVIYFKWISRKENKCCDRLSKAIRKKG